MNERIIIFCMFAVIAYTGKSKRKKILVKTKVRCNIQPGNITSAGKHCHLTGVSLLNYALKRKSLVSFVHINNRKLHKTKGHNSKMCTENKTGSISVRVLSVVQMSASLFF